MLHGLEAQGQLNGMVVAVQEFIARRDEYRILDLNGHARTVRPEFLRGFDPDPGDSTRFPILL